MIFPNFTAMVLLAKYRGFVKQIVLFAKYQGFVTKSSKSSLNFFEYFENYNKLYSNLANLS